MAAASRTAEGGGDSGGGLAIIAGNGVLPLELAEVLSAQGRRFVVVGIEGEADPALSRFPGEMIAWGKIAKLFRLLKANDVDRVVLAGGIRARPEIKLSMVDFGALTTLPGILVAMLGGDNTILTGVMTVFAKKGFEVVSVPTIAPHLVVQTGMAGGRKPTANDLKRMEEGMRVTRALGAHDIGQGCVVIGRRAVAVEGIEGTDEMLERVARLRSLGRLPFGRSGVLVKCLKPGQDERADLPTIGPRTVANVHAAGLKGIGVEAGKTLILEREETVRLARDLAVFIYGLGGDGSQ